MSTKFGSRKNYILPDEDCWIKQYTRLPESLRMDDELFEEIWDLHPDTQTKTNIGTFHRFESSFGKDYNFSGTQHKARDLNEHPFLGKLLDFVKEHSGEDYNQLFINWYSDGGDYIGYHADKNTLPGTSVYSFSYGQEREFYVRPIANKSVDPDFKLDLTMPDNSMLIMGGRMQEFYKHSVPKRSKNKYPARRINITMRIFE